MYEIRLFLRPALYPVVNFFRGAILLKIHHPPPLGLNFLIVREREYAHGVPHAGLDTHFARGIATCLSGTGAGGSLPPLTARQTA